MCIGKHFDANLIHLFCESLGIKHKFSAPYNPQANGLAVYKQHTIGYFKEEAWELCETLLPTVLWAYCTMPKYSTRLSPIHLVYCTEAILPTEIMTPTSRRLAVEMEANDQLLAQEKACIDETREEAVQYIMRYFEEIKRHYNMQIKKRDFKTGNWVLRRVCRLSEQGKLD